MQQSINNDKKAVKPSELKKLLQAQEEDYTCNALFIDNSSITDGQTENLKCFLINTVPQKGTVASKGDMKHNKSVTASVPSKRISTPVLADEQGGVGLQPDPQAQPKGPRFGEDNTGSLPNEHQKEGVGYSHPTKQEGGNYAEPKHNDPFIHPAAGTKETHVVEKLKKRLGTTGTSSKQQMHHSIGEVQEAHDNFLEKEIKVEVEELMIP